MLNVYEVGCNVSKTDWNHCTCPIKHSVITLEDMKYMYSRTSVNIINTIRVLAENKNSQI